MTEHEVRQMAKKLGYKVRGQLGLGVYRFVLKDASGQKVMCADMDQIGAFLSEKLNETKM